MAGSHSSGRPGGNPDLKQFQFEVQNPDGPLSSQVCIRISVQMKADIEQYLGSEWRYHVRLHLEKLIEARKRR